MCFYAYKRINHFREILAQFQAKETTQIPDEVLSDIKNQIRKERITNKQLTNKKAILLGDGPSGDGDGDGERERVHHGTFNVEGIVMDGELVLVDKKSKAVYSSTERLPNGEHVRIEIGRAHV